ncbi:unnamed protein product, partial [marine sediment metagenome]
FLVFQEFSQLLPWKTVYENVEFGLKLQNQRQPNKVKHTIHLVGLAGFEQYYPHQLSGGMKQRVAIARALVMNPSVLLMDEPFGSLDAPMRRKMRRELVQIWQKIRKTIVFVTHNIQESIILADRIMVLTRCPSKINALVHVDLPRPRGLATPAFGRLWQKLLNLTEMEV